MIAVQIFELDSSLSLTILQNSFRAQAHEHRRSVGRGDRQAFRAPGGDQTDVAIFFHAETYRLTPEKSLIVIVAARVHEHVAADRSHVPELWCRDGCRRVSQSRQLLSDVVMIDTAVRLSPAPIQSPSLV